MYQAPITANVPVADLVYWFASLGSHLVIEFVTKDDAMVEKLLKNKDDIYDDYEIGHFESLLGERFEIVEKETFHGGTRTLYFAAPKTRASGSDLRPSPSSA